MITNRQTRERNSLVGLGIILGLFALSQAALLLAVHTGLDDWRDPFHGPRLRRLRQRLEGAAQRPFTVVMLGSSRVYRGLRGNLLEPVLSQELGRPVVVYNLGKEGAGPVMNLYTWQRLCRTGVKPDLVLIELLPVMCGEKGLGDELDMGLRDFTLSWADLDFLERYSPTRGPGARLHWVTGQLTPILHHRLVIINRFAPWLLPVSHRLAPTPLVGASGDGPYELERHTAEQRRANIDRMADVFTESYRSALPAERPLRALSELLADCHARGVATHLVYMPEAGKLRACLPGAKRQALEAAVKELRHRYAAASTDARDWIDDDGFVDGLHLRASGADAFTQRLGQAVILPHVRSSTR